MGQSKKVMQICTCLKKSCLWGAVKGKFGLEYYIILFVVLLACLWYSHFIFYLF